MRALVKCCSICELMDEICGPLIDQVCQQCSDDILIPEEDDNIELPEVNEAHRKSHYTANIHTGATHAGSSAAMRGKIKTIYAFRSI